MAKPVSLNSFSVRRSLACARVCVCYGLVTDTCLRSGTARGRLSKNNLNPKGECVLSSILSRPLWPRLEGLEVEVCWAEVSGNSFKFVCIHTDKYAGQHQDPYVPAGLVVADCNAENKMHTGTLWNNETHTKCTKY